MAAGSRTLFEKLILHLHDMGRLATLDEIVDDVDDSHLTELRERFGADLTRPEALLKFLRILPSTFYVGDAETPDGLVRTCVSLSRKYDCYTLRMAHVLGDVQGNSKESLLLDSRRVKLSDDVTSSFVNEYLLSECALAIIEVLDVLDTCAAERPDFKTSFHNTLQTLEKMSGSSGRTILMFCSPDGSLRSGLRSFLSLFPKAFTVRGKSIQVQAFYFSRLRITIETDLLWGFIGTRLYRGVLAVCAITREVRCFVDNIGFKNDWDVTDTLIKSLIRAWFPDFFVAEGGRIYRAPNPREVHEECLMEIEQFFSRFLAYQTERLPWGHCFHLLKKHRPDLVEQWPSATSASIASFLRAYGDGFDIVDGYLEQTLQSDEPRLIDENNFRVEVPNCIFSPGLCPSSLFRQRAVGVVSEVALRSAIVVFPRNRKGEGEGRAVDCFGFCHVDVTTHHRKPVEDMTAHIEPGDCVEFLYDVSRSPHVMRPCFATVLNILQVHPRSEEDLEEEEDQEIEDDYDDSLSCCRETTEEIRIHVHRYPETSVLRDSSSITNLGEGGCTGEDVGASRVPTMQVKGPLVEGTVRARRGPSKRQLLYDRRAHCLQCRAFASQEVGRPTTAGRKKSSNPSETRVSDHHQTSTAVKKTSSTIQKKEHGVWESSFCTADEKESPNRRTDVPGLPITSVDRDVLRFALDGECSYPEHWVSMYGKQRSEIIDFHKSVRPDSPVEAESLILAEGSCRALSRRRGGSRARPTASASRPPARDEATITDRGRVGEQALQSMMRILGWDKILSDLGVHVALPDPSGSRSIAEHMVLKAVREASSMIEYRNSLANLLEVLYDPGPLTIVGLWEQDGAESSRSIDELN